MEKLRNLKNYHFGMGFLILLIQMVFQLSTAIYLFGLILILFSIYESIMVKKLTFQKGKAQRVRSILSPYKWVRFFALFPVLFFSGKLIMDVTTYENITELIFSNLVFSIHILVIGGVVLYLLMKFEIGKIEQALMEEYR